MTTTTATFALSDLAPYQRTLLTQFAVDPTKATAFAKRAGSVCALCESWLMRGRWTPYTAQGRHFGLCDACTADFPTALLRARRVLVRSEVDVLVATGSRRLRAHRARRVVHARRP